MSKKQKQALSKPAAKGMTAIHPARADEAHGVPFSDADPKRRLGNFQGAGEHARVGGRTSGIVGQKKSKSHRDHKGAHV